MKGEEERAKRVGRVRRRRKSIQSDAKRLGWGGRGRGGEGREVLTKETDMLICV